MRIEEGSNRCGGSVTGVELGLRKKKAGLTGGARMSARGEEK
jgi:hypothetical protein